MELEEGAIEVDVEYGFQVVKEWLKKRVKSGGMFRVNEILK